MKISASIYSNTGSDLIASVEELIKHKVDLLHVDCNDDISVFEDINKIKSITNTPIDLHIIADNIEKYYPYLSTNTPAYVTYQYENLNHSIIDFPRFENCRNGLAISSDTPVNVFDKYAHCCDFILIMATTPGKSGGVFNKENFKKIREFKSLYPDKRVHVDGGVNGEISFILRNMGVYAAVSGSYLFKENNIGLSLLSLKTFDTESHYNVKDFMMTNGEIPLLPREKKTLLDVLQTIEKYKMGFCISVDEKNNLLGIISNADIRRAMIKNYTSLEKISADDMLNKSPVFIEENATVSDMIRLIKSKNFPISYLPVVNSNKQVCGAITFMNLIKGEA
jgi:pentose-5-phosphate-3-epimerase/CBS domain-containing protein